MEASFDTAWQTRGSGCHSRMIGPNICAYHKNPKIYRMKYLPDGKPLKDDMLREALNNITLSLKRILSQLVCLGSTQSNENFNNMVASKEPCIWGNNIIGLKSISCCSPEEWRIYIYQSDALLSPGVVSKLHGIRMDKKKLWNKKQQSSIAFKRRWLLLKVMMHENNKNLNCNAILLCVKFTGQLQ